VKRGRKKEEGEEEQEKRENDMRKQEKVRRKVEKKNIPNVCLSRKQF
jgi:hypothetical protein